MSDVGHEIDPHGIFACGNILEPLQSHRAINTIDGGGHSLAQETFNRRQLRVVQRFVCMTVGIDKPRCQDLAGDIQGSGGTACGQVADSDYTISVDGDIGVVAGITCAIYHGATDQ